MSTRQFKGQGSMHSNPDCKIDATISPINFESCVDGAFEGSLGNISAEITEVPIKIAIPFMKKRQKLPVIATIGGFKIKLAPFQIKIEKASLNLSGVFGSKGIEGKMDCKVACKTDVELAGKLSGKVGLAHLDLGDDDFDEKKWCG